MRRFLLRLATVFVGLLAMSPIHADQIILDDGTTIVGKIHSQKEGMLEIQQADGKITFVNILRVKSIREGEVKIEPRPEARADDLYGDKVKRLEQELEAARKLAAEQQQKSAVERLNSLEQDLASLKSDMSTSLSSLDRLNALEDRLDDIRRENQDAIAKLQADLTGNSTELVKMIAAMSALEDKVSAYQPPKEGTDLRVGEYELDVMKKAIAELQSAVANMQGIVADIQELKRSQVELSGRLNQLADERVTTLERNDSALRAEVDALKSQMAGMKNASSVAAPALPRPEMTSAAAPVATAVETTGTSPAPWHVNLWRRLGVDPTLAGASTEEKLNWYDAESCRKWRDVAGSAWELADQLFGKAQAIQRAGRAAPDAMARRYEIARAMYVLAFAEYSTVFDNSQDPECTAAMLRLTDRIEECRLRIDYLHRGK